MPKIIKHLYQRTITYKGKKVKAWYFWYYDASGKQVRRTCGRGKSPCLLKREAERFLAELDDGDLAVTEKRTLREFVSGLYDEDSQFLKRRIAKGFETAGVTRRQKAYRLNVILEKFGERDPACLPLTEIEDWLLSFGFTNGWRNSMLTVVRDVYEVLYSENAIRKMPVVSGFKRRKVSTKGILSSEEISRLFPQDEQSIRKVWCRDGDSFYDGFSLCAICFCILSTGMRSGEARAVQKSQFVKSDILLLNAALDNDNIRTDSLKKHTENDKRWRIVVLPDRAVSMLSRLSELRDEKSEYVFERNGKPLDRTFLLDRFKFALRNIGVDAKARNITVHSLRFTYNTMMKGEVSGEDLRLMMGHVSESMTDYYDRADVLDKLPTLLLNKDKINEVWS